MPVISKAISQVRRSGANPSLQERGWLSSWLWGGRTLSGATVNDRTALSLTAFNRGIRLISSAIAGLPIHVYEEQADGERVRVKDEATAYLWRRPNAEMTKVSLFERVVADEIRGNAFLWVEKDDIGGVAGIWHLSRHRVQVGRTESGQKVYQVDGELPMIDYRDGGEIVHIPNWGDNLIGYDVVKMAANAIALGLSAEEFASTAVGEGEVPPGIITSEQTLTEAQAEEISRRWSTKHGSVKRSQKVAVLGNGAKFQAVARNLEEMSIEPLRQYQAGEMATLLGIPPHMLGLVDRTTSWGTGIAELGQGFVTYTLNAHITRLKQAIDDALLVRELTNRYVEFDPGGLLRGSIQQQAVVYATAYGRWMTVNEIRRDQNLPALPEGDVLLTPVNMAPLSAMESAQMAQPTGAGAPAK